MVDLKKCVLPAAIQVAGSWYAVKTDFRDVLAFYALLAEGGHAYADFDFMYTTDGVPADRAAGFAAMRELFEKENPLPRAVGAQSGERLVDYDIDADLIYAAFYEQYGIDLLTARLHWYQFKALFAGLHGTKLNDVMGYRAYDANDKRKPEQLQAELKAAWHIEAALTAEEQAALDEFDREFS